MLFWRTVLILMRTKSNGLGVETFWSWPQTLQFKYFDLSLHAVTWFSSAVGNYWQYVHPTHQTSVWWASLPTPSHCSQDTEWEIFRIGTVRYNWPISAHASQAFSIVHCTDSEDLPTESAAPRRTLCQHSTTLTLLLYKNLALGLTRIHSFIKTTQRKHLAGYRHATVLYKICMLRECIYGECAHRNVRRI